MSVTPVIKIQHGTKQFGSFTALERISFDVYPGEVVGFVGANGAGKTTTISAILGFIGLTHGQIELFGDKVTPQNAHRSHARIGYASGDMALPLRLTGKQYLEFALHQLNGEHREHYNELCKRFQPQLDKKIGELSRGNKQKIALVAAFMAEPELLIFDEPTSGLDPVMQEVFLTLMRETQERGGTVFMSSHYLTEVADVCSRVVLMREGKIIRDISAKELRDAGGKAVSITTTYSRTLPPKGAIGVEKKMQGDVLSLSFWYKGELAQLQQWVAGIKQLQDLEITEHSLDGIFASLYEKEQTS